MKFASELRFDNAIVWTAPSVVSAMVDQLQSQPRNCSLSPFLLNPPQETELICNELAFVPRLMPNLNVHVTRELSSSYMHRVSELVGRFLEQTETSALLRGLVERAATEDEAAIALAHAFFADALPFLKFATPDSIQG